MLVTTKAIIYERRTSSQIDGPQPGRGTRLKRISYNRKGGGAPNTKPGSGDGRIIKIVSARDFSVSERVLLNLKTTQAFEEVVADLGQVSVLQ